MKAQKEDASAEAQTSDTEATTVSAEVKQQIADEAIKAFLATNNVRVIKENSDYFVNSKNILIKYRNLSETKKYFESKQEALLKRMLEAESKEAFNSSEFNASLVKHLSV